MCLKSTNKEFIVLYILVKGIQCKIKMRIWQGLFPKCLLTFTTLNPPSELHILDGKQECFKVFYPKKLLIHPK